MTKRVLSLLLVAVFCLTALVACGPNEEEPQTSETQASDSVSLSTESNSQKLNDEDTLADYNFKGAEYKILARESTLYEFNHENDSGVDVVNNAVFLRNQQVSDRFNVNLRFEKVNGDWQVDSNNNPAGSAFHTKYSTIVQSGWSEYSLVSAHFVMQSTISVSGFCRDLTTLETVDMQKEWWSKPFYDACNIEGKFYVALGDIAHNLYEYMEVVFFNETMAESYLKDAAGAPIDLYQLVEDGKWTWEKMKEYTLAVSYNADDPEYGLLMNGHALKTMMMAMDLNVSEKNSDTGRWEFPTVASEKITNRFDEVASFMTTTPNVSFDVRSATDEARLNPIFAAGDGLFYTQTLNQVNYLGENMATGQEYGILPFPKYDEDQLDYLTTMRDSVTAVTVPKNVQDLEMVGVVTEALCMYGYQNVRPVYLDTVVKGRYLTDSTLSDMLDMIREGVTASFDMAYSASLGYPYSTICDLVKDTSLNFTSRYAARQSTWSANAAKVYESLGVSS